jgi:hypothetical protein
MAKSLDNISGNELSTDEGAVSGAGFGSTETNQQVASPD